MASCRPRRSCRRPGVHPCPSKSTFGARLARRLRAADPDHRGAAAPRRVLAGFASARPCPSSTAACASPRPWSDPQADMTTARALRALRRHASVEGHRAERGDETSPSRAASSRCSPALASGQTYAPLPPPRRHQTGAVAAAPGAATATSSASPADHQERHDVFAAAGRRRPAALLHALPQSITKSATLTPGWRSRSGLGEASRRRRLPPARASTCPSKTAVSLLATTTGAMKATMLPTAAEGHLPHALRCRHRRRPRLPRSTFNANTNTATDIAAFVPLPRARYGRSRSPSRPPLRWPTASSTWPRAAMVSRPTTPRPEPSCGAGPAWPTAAAPSWPADHLYVGGRSRRRRRRASSRDDVRDSELSSDADFDWPRRRKRRRIRSSAESLDRLTSVGFGRQRRRPVQHAVRYRGQLRAIRRGTGRTSRASTSYGPCRRGGLVQRGRHLPRPAADRPPPAASRTERDTVISPRSRRLR